MPAASLAMHSNPGSKPLCMEAVIGHTVMVASDDRVQLAQTCLDFIQQLGEGELVNNTHC